MLAYHVQPINTFWQDLKDVPVVRSIKHFKSARETNVTHYVE